MRLSNSKLKTWRRCPKRYEFKYVHKLRLKKRAIQLELGSWVHDLLMYHHDGQEWRERHEELERDFFNLFEEEREHLADLPAEAERLVQSYLLRYHKEDKLYRTVDTELDEIITLPNGIQFNFIIDRIVEDRDGNLWLWDYKTGGKFLPPDFLLLDAQLTRYFWCAEYMGYTPLLGVVFDEIRTKAPTVPRLLKNETLSQAKNIDTDLYTYFREIKRHRLDPKDYTKTLKRLRGQTEKFFRRTYMPRDKVVTRRMMQELTMSAREIQRAERKDEFPRTVEKSCSWDCDYLGPCVIQLQGGDISHEVKLRYTKLKREED